MAGLYVHIPFCLSKCRYCGFYSEGGNSFIPHAYIAALKKDSLREAPLWKDHTFRSVYIGGGTPSLLASHELADLLNHLGQNYNLQDAEITVEVNPATIDRMRFEGYLRAGVNRISIGVQSLISHELIFLERRHNPTQARALLKWASDFSDLSVSADIIIGIPGQTRDSLTWTLDVVLNYVDHLSCYMLSIDKGTRLYRDVKGGKVKLPSDDQLVRLYRLTDTLIEEHSFVHYEVSNWAKPGHESIHNLNYWSCGEYLGIGAGAHSHLCGRRYMRVSDWKTYVDLVESGRSTITMEECLTDEQKAIERVMLALRTSHGLKVDDFEGMFNKHALKLLDDLILRGLLIKSGENLLLSPSGMLLECEIAKMLVSELASPQVLLA